MTRRLLKQVPLCLATTEYAYLRQQILRRDGWRCQACDAMSNLELHHRQFRHQGRLRFRAEPDHAVSGLRWQHSSQLKRIGPLRLGFRVSRSTNECEKGACHGFLQLNRLAAFLMAWVPLLLWQRVVSFAFCHRITV